VAQIVCLFISFGRPGNLKDFLFFKILPVTLSKIDGGSQLGGEKFMERIEPSALLMTLKVQRKNISKN